MIDNLRFTRKGISMNLMKLFTDLFFTDYGILSLLVIVFIIVMGVWYWRFFVRKMNQKPGSK